MIIRSKKIESLARGLIDEFEVFEPPVPVERIAEGLGIDVRRERLTDSTLSGFLFREGDRTVLGINANDPDVRQRFTIAHEIGHFLLHDDTVHLDRAVKAALHLRGVRASRGNDPKEIEANRFAATLLMPRQFVHQDMVKLIADDIDEDELDQQLQDLSRKRYKVSHQAFLIRLAKLGFILQ